MNKRIVLLILLLLFVLQNASAQEYREVTKDSRPAFPRDLYYRPDHRIQWWYFTGHLFDGSGNEFGYELTFFVAGVQRSEIPSRFGVNNVYVSHFAITDVAQNKYFFSDRSDSGAYGFAGADGNKLKVWVSGNMMEGDTKKIHLSASGSGRELDLVLTPVKPLVLHGEGGYSRKSGDSSLSASLYFSYTNMETEGSLKTGDRVLRVKGKSWFDRELFSGRRGEKQEGWDWLGIQLDDGREIMLYIIRNNNGTTDKYLSGTFIYGDGSSRSLSSSDFSITTKRYYRSSGTGARYPALWDISIPSEQIRLRITPLVEDQEFSAQYSTGNYYWEGTCTVEGSATGRAYVEMTGYR